MINTILNLFSQVFTAVGRWFGASLSAIGATSLVVAGITAFAVYRHLISPFMGKVFSSSDKVKGYKNDRN